MKKIIDEYVLYKWGWLMMKKHPIIIIALLITGAIALGCGCGWRQSIFFPGGRNIYNVTEGAVHFG
ncbi:MAG TPA: hypothetical protein GX004_04430 [Firmicutes bacterium]|nr:hypothetical protein [Bacillota bacterium]